jgi:hypothetical protein
MFTVVNLVMDVFLLYACTSCTFNQLELEISNIIYRKAESLESLETGNSGRNQCNHMELDTTGAGIGRRMIYLEFLLCEPFAPRVLRTCRMFNIITED